MVCHAVSVTENGDFGITIYYNRNTTQETDKNASQSDIYNLLNDPELQTVTYRIGIPQNGSITYRITRIEEERLPADQVPVVRDLSIEEPVGPYAGTAAGVVRPMPAEPVQLSAPGWFRDLYTAQLRLNPVYQDPATGELVLVRRLTIAVAFHGDPVSRPQSNSQFERVYEKAVVNYGQCRSWRRLAGRSGHDPFAVSLHWFKIIVGTEGLYRIGEDELRAVGLDPRQFDPRTMKIYTAPYELLSASVHTAFADSLVEVPVVVQGEADGAFDGDDYLVFYGFPANHYQWDSTLNWFENGYARERVYWFTFGNGYGRRMESRICAWNGDPPDTLVTDFVHIEQDVSNPTRSGINWFWRDISPQTGPSGGTSLEVLHPHASGRARLIVGLYTVSSPAPDTFQYKTYLDDAPFLDALLVLKNQDTYPPLELTAEGAIDGDSSVFRIDILRPAGTVTTLTAFLNHVELEYDRITDLAQPGHAFYPAARSYTVRGRNVKSEPYVLDITDPLNPVQLDSLRYEDKTVTFTHRSDSFQVLYLAQEASAEPAMLVPRNPGRLRQSDPGAEYLIITHPRFYNALMPLVAYRSRDYSVKVLAVDDIYDDYALGKYDPLAIKHFLHATLDDWSRPPVYVLLVGDATYDYKNNLNKADPPNFVPMYESGTTLTGNAGIPPNYIYDGEYVNFHNAGEEMILGRVTIRSNAELRAYIDKLTAYENTDIDGMWNKRLLLAADDEYANVPHPTEWEGLLHVMCCEGIANTVTDTLYDLTKVYMISYPPFIYPCMKPNAQEAFIRELNKGWFCGVFYGHGNTHQLAHEGIFYDTKIPLVRNGRRLGFFYFASCTVGRFDDSDYECIGEEFVRNPEIAIGTLAATAGTGAYSNQTIGRQLFQYMTQTDTAYTMGEAAYLARYGYWDLHYVLFGDPATRMRRVTERVAVAPAADSVRPFETVKVGVGYQPYYLTAWVRTIKDTIQKFNAQTANSICGRVGRRVQTDDTLFTYYEYWIYGREFYQGFWQTESASFIAPRIPTNNLPLIRMSAYKNDRSGVFDSLIVFGTAAISSDTVSPVLILYDGGRKLKDGDWVDPQFSLTGRITDSSGINFMNSKDDSRGFYLYQNVNIENKIDLRDYFMYDRNSYIAGEFNLGITMIKPQDTIVVSVSDNVYNRKIVKIQLNSELYNLLSIDNLLVYPNPVKDERGAWFAFNLTASGSVTIRVFTIAGRLIKTIAKRPGNAGYNQIFWDGRDERQVRLANGVYLVKAVVENESGTDDITETFIIAR